MIGCNGFFGSFASAQYICGCTRLRSLSGDVGSGEVSLTTSRSGVKISVSGREYGDGLARNFRGSEAIREPAEVLNVLSQPSGGVLGSVIRGVSNGNPRWIAEPKSDVVASVCSVFGGAGRPRMETRQSSYSRYDVNRSASNRYTQNQHLPSPLSFCATHMAPDIRM